MSVSHKQQMRSSKLFFNDRAKALPPALGLADLCYASGRDARLWLRPGIYNDLIESLREQLDLTLEHSLLEVGCAVGFVATGIAPYCLRYTGVDLAPAAIDRAKALGLVNTDFRVADAMSLPFPDYSFDRALCQDVITNFSSLAMVEKLLSEMIRVVIPGGRVLVGSIPDDECKAQYHERTHEVTAALQQQEGPAFIPTASPAGIGMRLTQWILRRLGRIEPAISCYYFRREDFVRIGAALQCQVSLEDIHPLNPYRGYRFNAIYTKGQE